jgi:hypothetical protein
MTVIAYALHPPFGAVIAMSASDAAIQLSSRRTLACLAEGSQ